MHHNKKPSDQRVEVVIDRNSSNRPIKPIVQHDQGVQRTQRSQRGHKNVQSTPLTRKAMKLQEERDALRDRLSRRKDTLEVIKEEEKRLRAENAKWRKEIEDTSHKLGVVRQDLEAGRENMFVGGENGSALTVRRIVEQFVPLKQAILDIGREARRSCDDGGLTAKPSSIYKFGRNLGIDNLNSFLAKSTDPLKQPKYDVGNFICPIVCHILCDRLLRYIFEPFAPGMEEGQSEFFGRIYKAVVEQQGLDKATRWRAVTYSQLDLPSIDFAHKVTKKILKDFDNICPNTVVSEVLNDNHHIRDGVHALVVKAIQFQYANRRNCVTVDLAPFSINYGQQFNSVLIETFNPSTKIKPAFVVLTTMLGLEHIERETRPDGSVFDHRKIWQAATAVCTNWSYK